MSLLKCSLSYVVSKFLVTSALPSLFLFYLYVTVPFMVRVQQLNGRLCLLDIGRRVFFSVESIHFWLIENIQLWLEACSSGTTRPSLLETVNRIILWAVHWKIQCTTCERVLDDICQQISPGIQNPLQNGFSWWRFQISSCRFFVNADCPQPFIVLFGAQWLEWLVPT